MTLRRFHIPRDLIGAGTFEFPAAEAHHARDVLRLKSGAEIRVFDGEGREYAAVVDYVDRNAVRATVIGPVEPSAPESPLSITLGSVVIPGDRYDLIVQKCVELGIVRLVPLASIRSEMTLRDISKRMARWERIALDAAKQCGRAKLMEIADPMDVSQFLVGSSSGERLFFSERSGGPIEQHPTIDRLSAVIGPKGGWDDSEIAKARDAGFTIVTLGGRIMRAETAAIALTAILQHRFGDIN